MSDATESITPLIELLVDRHGGPISHAEPPTSTNEGFDSAIHFFRLRGPSLPEMWQSDLVLRIKPDDDRERIARRETAIQDWLSDRGYPAPTVLETFGVDGPWGRPAQVMERLPGVMALDALRSQPWQVRRHLDAMARLHVRLHGMPTDGFPGDGDLLDRRLSLVRESADTLGDDDLRRGLASVEALASRLRDARPAVCHGDFHPLNVIVDPAGTSGVVDWTDAGLGDRHGDVARTLVLFDVAELAASSPREARVLKTVGRTLGALYRRRYERWSPLDQRRLALWRPVHLLHGWTQARSLHAGLFDGEGAADAGEDRRTVRVPPAIVDELARRFEESMAAI